MYPPFSVLGEAELLDEDSVEIKTRRTLASTVQEAVEANLDLAAQDRTVAAGHEEVRRARSDLLPQVEVSALGRIIDEDRAAASFGSQAEQTVTGTASLSQVIYADPAWANLSIQKNLQTAREQEREAVRLDITLEAAASYLNVLRAKAVERIEKQNLNLTRSNLELAKVRQSIGISGPAEVYRWEAAIANSRQVVLQAVSRRQQAERALNRLLNRPLDELFTTEDVALDDPILLTSDERFRKSVNNPWALAVFRSFMVKEGLANSVELRGLDAAIAAQERLLASTKRSFWAPTAALSGEVTQFLAEEGAGKDPITIPGFPGGAALPRKDDTDWGVGVSVSLPLFEGGLRFADKKRAIEELARLRIERQATRERIALAIETAVLKMQASVPEHPLFPGRQEGLAQEPRTGAGLLLPGCRFGHRPDRCPDLGPGVLPGSGQCGLRFPARPDGDGAGRERLRLLQDARGPGRLVQQAGRVLQGERGHGAIALLHPGRVPGTEGREK